MDEQNGIYIPDTVCVAVQIVRKYINCDCGSDDCHFDKLVQAVSAQEEEQRKDREQREIIRQEEARIRQENQLE